MPSTPTLQDRRSGVLLHLTSLPGPHGIGDLGEESRSFADFLAAHGQSWWQMLPIGPPGYGHGPYMASSAFALSPLFLNLEELHKEGRLSREDLELPPAPEGRVDYERASALLEPRLRRAAERFFADASGEEQAAFEAFRERESSWLPDYALYCALNEEAKGAAWTDFEPETVRRDPAALERARERLAPEIRRHAWLQHELDRQWAAFREHCHARGIGLIGDVPIFVAHESADVWANPQVFFLDEKGLPTFVAGVPPDYFSVTGQRWGHPLYRWDELRASGYRWWMDRFRRALSMFDAVRIDHFIGFTRYWEIPASSPTAVEGRWVEGPGDDFFRVFVQEFGNAPMIAEDLGAVTPEVMALRERYAMPGMRVLQFAFSGDAKSNLHLPHLHEKSTVVYTGTHDNDTTAGWYQALRTAAASKSAKASAARAERDYLLRYLDTNGKEIHWDLIRLAFSSVADLAIIPAQDLLGLGSEARMNRPSEASGNWEWQLRRGGLTPEIGERLARLAAIYGRDP